MAKNNSSTKAKPSRSKALVGNSSKQSKIIKLLKRPKGASLAEICELSGWQPHSIRGFMSGTVRKRLQFKLTSELDNKGTRRYRIGKAERDLAVEPDCLPKSPSKQSSPKIDETASAQL